VETLDLNARDLLLNAGMLDTILPLPKKSARVEAPIATGGLHYRGTIDIGRQR
jgi:hypothetical protein